MMYLESKASALAMYLESKASALAIYPKAKGNDPTEATN
jgi:hypothetical protein